MGSGSHYAHQSLPRSCELLVFGVSVPGWGLTALGGVSVPVGISAAQAMAQHQQDAAGSSGCGILEPFPSGSLPQVDLAPSPTVQIKFLGSFDCWNLKPPAK